MTDPKFFTSWDIATQGIGNLTEDIDPNTEVWRCEDGSIVAGNAEAIHDIDPSCDDCTYAGTVGEYR